ncbi:MAG TPA: efflux RND transporter periplasmic adaptor subunit, partial [Gammaproteobacteria bacterium]|nr:efflux RND transporter periplasmic adaptor subunit [Gammaproteobacteria bacterium]
GVIDQVLVERGDLVKKDQVVAKLDMRLERLGLELARLRAKGRTDILSGKAQLDFRKREVSRIGELHKNNMASSRDYDTAEIEQRLAQLSLEKAELEHQIAQVEHSRAKALLDRYQIRSPVDGVVVEVTMFPGEYAYEQAAVMTIAEIDPLNVEVFVPVDRYGTIAVDMTAQVRPREPVGGNYRARVSIVDRVFDAASGTFGVRLELPNPDYALPAGLRCRVQFQGAAASGERQPADADLNLSVGTAQ